LAIPVKNNSIVLESEWQLEDEDLILSSDLGFVFIERLFHAGVTVTEVSGEGFSKSFFNLRIFGKKTSFLFFGWLGSTYQCT
jgi:hypothetical protein